MNERGVPRALRNNIAAYALAAASLVLGVGSLTAFTVFLYAGSLHLTDFGLTLSEQLWLDACLCLAFFVQHSAMIRRATRRRMSRLIPEPSLGAVFSIISGIILFSLVILWQESTLVLVSADGIPRQLLRAIFFVAVAGQVWGIWALKSADLFGAKTLMKGAATPLASMVVRGPYRWIRHPLYSTTLLMIWSYPELTADRLLFACLFTLWIIIGTVLEERDLVGTYGEAYRRYRRRVPMLIPYRKPIAAGLNNQ